MGYKMIAKNALIGDGSLFNKDTVASAAFYCKDISMLEYKKHLCEKEGVETRSIVKNMSGYKKGSFSYRFYTKSHPIFKEVGDAGMSLVIKDLTKEDLFLWYLDDGSWHKKKNIMHLYSNMLTSSQTDELINQINKLYGFPPTKRIDKKKDGREFFYLYFPRKLVEVIRYDIKEFIIENNLTSFLYKVGE